MYAILNIFNTVLWGFSLFFFLYFSYYYYSKGSFALINFNNGQLTTVLDSLKQIQSVCISVRKEVSI